MSRLNFTTMSRLSRCSPVTRLPTPPHRLTVFSWSFPAAGSIPWIRIRLSISSSCTPFSAALRVSFMPLSSVL